MSRKRSELHLVGALIAGGRYIKEHVQLVFIILLLLVLPLLFLYSGQQFLSVARQNQDRLEKDRVGTIQDSLSLLLQGSNFNMHALQQVLTQLTTDDPDLSDVAIEHVRADQQIEVLASSASSSVGTKHPSSDFYRAATVRTDQSVIFEVNYHGARSWLIYRALERSPGDMYYITSTLSLGNIDNLFHQRELSAYWSLAMVYLFCIGLAYWHIKLTDYRYLYAKTREESAAKDVFTNMLAHELRAPLSAMQGYASMIVETNSIDEAHSYASRISDATKRLLVIISDLLDVARIQSGKLSIEPQLVDVNDIVASVIGEQESAALERNVSLLAEGMDKPNRVSTDPKRLQQALTNLVSNALKYTKEGSVTIAVKELHDMLEIRVKDTGMGIAARDQQKLFAPFFRVNRADVNAMTGTGLGMWITRHIIELLQGNVDVESIEGVGTHVVVTLPETFTLKRKLIPKT